MRSDIVKIDNQGNGFTEAVEQTKKVAAFEGLGHQESIRLQLLTEEMLSLARSVTGEMEATFWIEGEGLRFELHMNTRTVMDKEKRYLLLSSASSQKNEAAKGFLGKLRDILEAAMASDAEHVENEIPYELLDDIANQPIEAPEWDGYERSVLRKLADNVRISIRGGVVDVMVSKDFSK